IRKSQPGQIREARTEKDSNQYRCCPAMSSRYEPVKLPTEQVAHSNGQAKVKQSQHTIIPCRRYLPALLYINTSTEASCATVSSRVANRDFVPTIPKKRYVCSGELQLRTASWRTD